MQGIARGVHLRVEMPDYRTSYSMPRARVKENESKGVTVFSPQCLLNNPITDPKHSQYVQKCIQDRLDKEEHMTDLNIQKGMNMNISVRKDLHIRNKTDYRGIDMSYNKKR